MSPLAPRSGIRLAMFCAILALLGHAGCQRAETPLPQRGYLWQKVWTPAVAAALPEANDRLDGVVVLAGEIRLGGGVPRVQRVDVPWDVLAKSGREYAIAIRVAPFPGPFAPDDAAADAIVNTALSLIERAASHGVKVAEFQIDFDAAQRKLAGYRLWIERLRGAIRPLPLVLTALPSWLDEPEFLPLIRAADGYVLQVHSVPTVEIGGRSALCDPALARRWVARAAKLGAPFSVALPTYRCLAGYSPAGELIGVIMDSVRPAWPPGTRVLEFESDAREIAGLVAEWRKERPAGMRELIWYRVPVASDVFNWRWPTLAAVMEGREPVHRLEVVAVGKNPVDLRIVNSGESDERLDGQVTVTWARGTLIAADALAGWTVRTGQGRAVFVPDLGRAPRLSPGASRSIGWIRHDHSTPLGLEIAPRQP